VRAGLRHPGIADGSRHDDAGGNLAGLYSLVATCEANGVNPLAYLEDVLIRVHEHPNSRIDELLPHHWQPTDRSQQGATAQQ
jgi:hypothetical protein